MSSSTHCSVIVNKSVRDSQLTDGVRPHEVVSTDSLHAIRWNGLFKMAHKARILQKHLKKGLTGDESGSCHGHTGHGRTHDTQRLRK